MVGAGTFLADSPKLTVRDDAGNTLKTPARFVLSSRKLNLPAGWEQAVLKNAAEWETFLTGLGKRPFVSLLLEGGGELAASALNAGIVDKIEFHYAPKILGGRNSRPGVGGPDPLTLSEAFPIENMSVRQLGADIAVTGYPRKPEERRF